MPIELLISAVSPLLGGLLGVIRKPRLAVVYHLLAFAGGIMLAVSFCDLMPEGITQGGYLPCLFGLVAGFFIMYLVHLLMPTGESIKETATFLAVGMAVHNGAEGMAVAIAANLNHTLNVIVVASIVIHDFAEGLCTASPLYYSSKNKLKSFVTTALTSLPLIVGYYSVALIFHSISPVTLGFLLGAVSGLMLNITLCELIPQSAHKVTGFATEFSLMLGIITVVLLEYL